MATRRSSLTKWNEISQIILYNSTAICEVIPRERFYCGRSYIEIVLDFYAQLHEIVSLNPGDKRRYAKGYM